MDTLTSKGDVAAKVANTTLIASNDLPKGSNAMQRPNALHKEGLAGSSSNWADLFKENRKIEHGIKLKEWKVGEREIEEKDLTNVEDSWGICLVGYILGRFPGRKAIDEVRNAWGVKHHFYIHTSGWMVFKFDTQEDKESVLAKGPYNTYGTPWLLKTLPPFFNFGEDGLNFIPTWIQLPGLPLECWNDVVLGKIVSNIGKPISTDQCTALRSRPGFARVLVEVNMEEPLVEEVVFKLPNGGEIRQRVIFENPPVRCASCKRMGHSAAACKRSEMQGTRRSLSRGRRAGNRGAIHQQGGNKNSAQPAVVKEAQTHGNVAKKILEGPEKIGEQPNVKKDDLGAQNLAKKVEKVAGNIPQPRAVKGQPKVQVQGVEKELNLRPQVPLKNKGKMVEESHEERAPEMVVVDASSSNGLVDVHKNLEEAVDEDLDEDDERVRRVEKIKGYWANTSRSQVSPFIDMATMEELDELEEEMAVESKRKEKNNKRKGRNRSRGRHL